MSRQSERKTRTALLTNEAALLERMRRAVDAIVRSHFSTKPGVEAVNASIIRTAAALQRHLPAIIAAGRADARNAALKTLHADAAALSKALRANGEDGTLPELPMPSDSVQTDRARAKSSALAFAGAWQAAALGHVAESLAADRVARARDVIRAAAKSTDAHIDRIAATENSQAFNGERRAGAPTTGNVYTVWDSTLDERTCEVCAAMDGQRVHAAEPFRYAGRIVDPGHVHPNCRCLFHLSTRS